MDGNQVRFSISVLNEELTTHDFFMHTAKTQSNKTDAKPKLSIFRACMSILIVGFVLHMFILSCGGATSSLKLTLK